MNDLKLSKLRGKEITLDSEAFNELCNKLHKEFLSRRTRERSFWEHITLIFATTISFSTIFFSQAVTPPNKFIIISLCLMIFGLLIGLILISESIYLISRQEEREAILRYNQKVIKKWFGGGKITDLERMGLELASIYSENYPQKNLIKGHPSIFSLLKESLEKLPSTKIFGKRKINDFKQKIQKTVTMNIGIVINIFYINTFISFLLFLLGLLAKK